MTAMKLGKLLPAMTSWSRGCYWFVGDPAPQFWLEGNPAPQFQLFPQCITEVSGMRAYENILRSDVTCIKGPAEDGIRDGW